MNSNDSNFVDVLEIARQRRLDSYLKNNYVLRVIESLYELAMSSGASRAECPVEKLALGCSEAIRYAYRMSRELGIPQ